MAEKWMLAAIYAKKETTFGVEPSASGAAYLFLKALEDATFEPTYDVIERNGLVNDLARQPHGVGAKAGKISFKTEVKGSGTPAALAVTAIAGECDELLQCALGTVARGTGTTVVAAGSTVTVVNATSAAGFSVGMMVILDCGATYGYVARFVTAISVNAVTLDHALPAVPANGAVFQASNKYTRANTGHGSMAFVGVRGAIQYSFQGCKLDSLKISNINSRGMAVFDWSFAVTDWQLSAKASLPSAVPAGITAVKAPIVKGAPFTVAGVEEPAFSVEIDFGLKFEFQESTAGLGPSNPDSVNAGLELVDSDPGGAIKAYYKAQHMTDFAADTQNTLMICVGLGLGNAWGFFAQNIQWVVPKFENKNGMVGQGLPFKVNDNSTLAEYYFCLA